MFTAILLFLGGGASGATGASASRSGAGFTINGEHQQELSNLEPTRLTSYFDHPGLYRPELADAHAALRKATEHLPSDKAEAERAIFESEGLFFGDNDEAHGHFQAFGATLQREHRQRVSFARRNNRRSLAERHPEAIRLIDRVDWNTSEQAVKSALAGTPGAHAAALVERWSSATCTDVLASNNGQDERCAYECSSLQQYYFPGQWVASRDRCYVYDTDSSAWPAELLDQKQSQKDWHVFLEPETAAGGIVSF